MSQGLSIEVIVADGGLSGALRRLGGLGARPRPVMAAAARVVGASTEARFDASKGPGGIAWKPIWSRQPKGKQKQVAPAMRKSGKPLVDTGSLRRSIKSTVDDNSAFIGPDGSGTSKFAAVHQFGATITPKKAGGLLVFAGPDGGLIFAKSVTIPARPFLGIDGQDVADIGDAVTDAIRRTWDGD